MACEGECAVAADLAVDDGPIVPPVADMARGPARDLATPPPPPDLAPAGDPLQPETHPDDPALRDPSRPSNCTGLTALAPAQLADFFPDGSGFWDPAADPRKSDSTKMRFTDQFRTCNQVTGCEMWWYVVPNTNPEFIFLFTYDGNQLWLQEYDWTGQYITQRLIDSPLVTASFAVHTGTGSGWEMRRMAVMLTQKRICLETLVTSTTDANGTHDRVTLAGFVHDYTTLTPRASPAPVPSPSPTCTGAAATQAELVAWFKPGTVYASLLNETKQSVERECHPLTGCSAWRSPFGTFFDHLSVQGTSILVNALNPGTNGRLDYPLTNSESSSSTLDIVFTPTCARASGSVVTDGPNANQLETVTIASVPKP
jgi:hypothetical protein